MFCKNCGNEVDENVPFCTNCGARLDVEVTSQPEQPVQQPYQNNPYQNNPYQNNPYQNNPYQQYNQQNAAYDKKVGFVDAVKLMFKNYVDFNGRASRSEYWWAFLFNFLVSFFVVGAISAVIPPIGGACSIALMIPGVALTVRRLHDRGKSWVYLLIGLIPLVGYILLIIQLAKPSDGPNQWG